MVESTDHTNITIEEFPNTVNNNLLDDLRLSLENIKPSEHEFDGFFP